MKSQQRMRKSAIEAPTQHNTDPSIEAATVAYAIETRANEREPVRFSQRYVLPWDQLWPTVSADLRNAPKVRSDDTEYQQ